MVSMSSDSNLETKSLKEDEDRERILQEKEEELIRMREEMLRMQEQLRLNMQNTQANGNANLNGVKQS